LTEMKHLMTLMALVVAVTAGAQTNWPYNPDSDNDGMITVEDLFSLLSTFGNDFEAAGLNIQTVDPDSLVREYWYTPGFWDEYECLYEISNGLYTCNIEIEDDTDVLFIDFEKEEYYATEFTIILPHGESEKSLMIAAVPPDIVIFQNYAGNNTYWESDCPISRVALYNNEKFVVVDNGDSEASGMVDFDVNGISVSVYQNQSLHTESLGKFIDSNSPNDPKESIIANYYRLNGRWTRLD